MENFNKIINRKQTNSLKWDIKENELPMWVADMEFTTAPEVIKAITKRAKHGIYGYSIIPDAWYDSIINWWKDHHDFIIQKDWLQFCTGVVAAISSCVKRLTNIGDNIVTLTPVYNIFFNSIENAGRHALECPLIYNGTNYKINFELLEQCLANPLTTMLIFCNPHNPVGKIYTKDELQKVGDLCAQYGVVVLSDEIHCDLTDPEQSYIPFASVSETCALNSVTCISASKAFNLAGLQSAAVIVRNQTLKNKVVRGLNSDEVAEPNCFAIESTVAAFSKGYPWLKQLREYIYENKKMVIEYLKKNKLNIHVTESHATYLLWLDCSQFTNNTDYFCDFLREKSGLYLSAGSKYRGNGHLFVRMNIACSKKQLMDGLNRLKEGILSYQK